MNADLIAECAERATLKIECHYQEYELFVYFMGVGTGDEEAMRCLIDTRFTLACIWD